MKRYQMLMLEWNLESVPLNEVDTIKMAGMGAGVGALGSAGVWAVKRLQLRKKLQACQGDPECQARVNEEIKSLRNNSLKSGAINTLGGAAIGYTGGVAHNAADRMIQRDIAETEKEMSATKFRNVDDLRNIMQLSLDRSEKAGWPRASEVLKNDIAKLDSERQAALDRNAAARSVLSQQDARNIWRR